MKHFILSLSIVVLSASVTKASTNDSTFIIPDDKNTQAVLPALSDIISIESLYHKMADQLYGIDNQYFYDCFSNCCFEKGLGLVLMHPHFNKMHTMNSTFQHDIVDAVSHGANGYAQDSEALKKLAELDWSDARRYYSYALEHGYGGVAKNHLELKRLAYLGWEDAQNRFISCLYSGTNDIPQDFQEIKKLADLGWKSAQWGIVFSLTLFTKNHEFNSTELKRLSDLGYEYAVSKYVEGLATGKYDIEQNSDELKKLALSGCQHAKKIYIKGLATGEFGIAQDLGELKKLAHSGCKYAQAIYVEGLATGKYDIRQDHVELKRLANVFHQCELEELFVQGFFGESGKIHDLGCFTDTTNYPNLNWDVAHRLYIRGLAEGKYGIQQNPDELVSLMYSDWRALWHVVRGFSSGEFGIKKNLDGLKELGERGSDKAKQLYIKGIAAHNPTELKRLADEDYCGAQDLYSLCLAKGMHGIVQNHEELKRLANLGWISAQVKYLEVLLMDDNHSCAILFLNAILLKKTE